MGGASSCALHAAQQLLVLSILPVPIHQQHSRACQDCQLHSQDEVRDDFVAMAVNVVGYPGKHCCFADGLAPAV